MEGKSLNVLTLCKTKRLANKTGFWREVNGLRSVQATGYPNCNLSWFYSVPSDKCWDITLKSAKISTTFHWMQSSFIRLSTIVSLRRI